MRRMAWWDLLLSLFFLLPGALPVAATLLEQEPLYCVRGAAICFGSARKSPRAWSAVKPIRVDTVGPQGDRCTFRVYATVVVKAIPLGLLGP